MINKLDTTQTTNALEEPSKEHVRVNTVQLANISSKDAERLKNDLNVLQKLLEQPFSTNTQLRDVITRISLVSYQLSQDIAAIGGLALSLTATTSVPKVLDKKIN